MWIHKASHSYFKRWLGYYEKCVGSLNHVLSGTINAICSITIWTPPTPHKTKSKPYCSSAWHPPTPPPPIIFQVMIWLFKDVLEACFWEKTPFLQLIVLSKLQTFPITYYTSVGISHIFRNVSHFSPYLALRLKSKSLYLNKNQHNIFNHILRDAKSNS